jgi:hypothetical protein
MLVSSDIILPVHPVADAWQDSRNGRDARLPDVEFRRAREGQRLPEPRGEVVASRPCPAHGVDMLVHRGPGGAWIWNRGAGTFHVSPDARRVDVYAEPAADERVLGLVLAGQVSVFLMHQLGRPTLHASAVVLDHGVVAFLGPKGQGKSSMAAGFVGRGATLLTDDVLPLRLEPDGVYAAPSLPLMKLFPESAACALDISGELPVLIPNYDKRLLQLDGRFAFAQVPEPLRALYLLERYDPAVRGTTAITIEPLAGRAALTALLAQISHGAFMQPRETARFLPLYQRLATQAPPRILRFPSGFEHSDAVRERIIADAAAGAAPAARPLEVAP